MVTDQPRNDRDLNPGVSQGHNLTTGSRAGAAPFFVQIFPHKFLFVKTTVAALYWANEYTSI